MRVAMYVLHKVRLNRWFGGAHFQILRNFDRVIPTNSLGNDNDRGHAAADATFSSSNVRPRDRLRVELKLGSTLKKI